MTAETVSAELDRLLASTQPGVAKLVREAFDLGFRSGRADGPVCDWCGERVVITDLGWCHRDTALFGCEPRPLWERRAQVAGQFAPAGHQYPTAEGSL